LLLASGRRTASWSQRRGCRPQPKLKEPLSEHIGDSLEGGIQARKESARYSNAMLPTAVQPSDIKAVSVFLMRPPR